MASMCEGFRPVLSLIDALDGLATACFQGEMFYCNLVARDLGLKKRNAVPFRFSSVLQRPCMVIGYLPDLFVHVILSFILANSLSYHIGHFL